MTSIETVIGYPFADPRLLETALTHTSYANENRAGGKGRLNDNQRLEFLGDSVLGLIVSRELFCAYPRKSEGDLTRLRAGIVCEASLAEAARAMDLGAYILLGRGEIRENLRSSTLADAFEALLAAMFLDGGIDPPSKLVRDRLINAPAIQADVFDYKTAYQEQIQDKGLPSPVYAVLSETGPEHDKLFEVAVSVDGRVTGSGTGKSKRAAERAAAKDAMQSGEVPL